MDKDQITSNEGDEVGTEPPRDACPTRGGHEHG